MFCSPPWRSAAALDAVCKGCFSPALLNMMSIRSFPESLIGEQATPELQAHVTEYLPEVKLLYVPNGTLMTHGMVYDKIFAFVDHGTIVDVRCDWAPVSGVDQGHLAH
jgi:hypothetical protein